MSISAVINLAICLTYLYLLFSLVASAIAELISSYWNLRGVGLRESIRHWLGDPAGIGAADYFYKHALIAGLIRPGADVPSLKRLSWLLPLTQPRLPSYIPKETAADALIDILARAGAFKTGEMQPGLQALWRTATGANPNDPAAAMKSFRDQVMAWFDNAMSRQGEHYTLWSQYRLFVIGAALAVSLNVDTLKIAATLWAPTSTEQINVMVEAATKLIEVGVPLEQAEIAKLNPSSLLQKIDNLPLPIGWGKDATGCDVVSHVLPDLLNFWPFSWVGRQFCPGGSSLKLEEITAAKWLGWLITALAISFGAQFWFDALGSFVRLRSGGLQPKSSEKPAASNG